MLLHRPNETKAFSQNAADEARVGATHTHTHSRQNSLLLTLGTVRPAAARQLNKYNKYGIHGFDQKQEMAAPTVYTQHTLPTLCRFHSKYMETRGFGGVQQTQNGKFFNEVK